MKTYTKSLIAILAALTLGLGACASDDPIDGENDTFGTGKGDSSVEAGSAAARAVLALVNDPLVDLEELDDDARLNARAARNIIAHRGGADGVYGSSDDNRFDSLEELDDVKYVGPTALAQLLAYAKAQGYLDAEAGKKIDVIFSPMPYEQSHNVKIAGLIDSAQHSVDIALYSFSDARISDAIERAVARGIEIRFVFETANSDRKASDLGNTKSGRLEAMGVNVRYVNKIMHHKMAIVDGPRDDLDRADTGTLVTGSGNWSNGAATRYDENTLFLTGYRELTLRFQAQFDHLWNNSRDFVFDASLAYELSTVALDEAAMPDDPSRHVYFTSDNFTVSNTTFRVAGKNTVSDQLVAAIEGADEQILIASGHLRSRPVAEALMAKMAARPDIDVRVLLDGQEYISSWYHNEQLNDIDDCLVAAGTSASQQRKCMDKGFYFGYQIQLAGAKVRYKYYSYRWHYSYAMQMHHKFLAIDGTDLWTGSYNLSDNAEHNTMENMVHFSGEEFASLVSAYIQNFEKLWELGRANGKLASLTNTVQTANPVPLVFDSMSLTWNEITELKAVIKANCADINDEAFRTEPETHKVCYR